MASRIEHVHGRRLLRAELDTLDGDDFEVLVTPIPEPGSALLRGLGTFPLGFRRLRA